MIGAVSTSSRLSPNQNGQPFAKAKRAMRPAIAEYFRELVVAAGDSWNRFWFTPSDPSALGVLRIVAGLTALYLHITLSFDLVRLFGPEAILSSELIGTMLDGPRPTYLDFFSTPAELWTVHLLGGMVLVLFTIGVFTRVTSVLALAVMLSTVHRAPVLTAEVEQVLAFAMFYLCIGPSGKAFSLDAWHDRTRRAALPPIRSKELEPRTEFFTATVATRLIQLHVALVYGMMAVVMLSSPNASWWLGDAVWFLIARPESRFVDMTWLADFPLLLNAWTHWIVLYSVVFVSLVWNRWSRPIVLLLGVPHWLLLSLVSGRPLFCLFMLALNMAFIPAAIVRNGAMSCNPLARR